MYDNVTEYFKGVSYNNERAIFKSPCEPIRVLKLGYFIGYKNDFPNILMKSSLFP